MHGTTGIDFADSFLEDLGAIDGAAGCRHARDEHFGAVRLQRVLDSAPVRHLKGRDGGPESDGVKPEQAVAEHDRVLRAGVCGSEKLGGGQA